MKNKKIWLTYMSAILSVLVLIVIDQYTKLLAIKHLKSNSAIPIWKGVFSLQYLENRGAAFGILQNKSLFFVIITLIMVLAIAYCYIRMPKTKLFLPLRIAAVLILAGAIGNFIDRVRYGYVVDFFYFELIDFPIFNVADICVTVPMVAIIVLLLFVYKDEDLNQIFKKKSKDE